MEPIEVPDYQELSLKNVIGFNGMTPNSLQVHPDRNHTVYILGCTIVIENIATKKQHFLQGHTSKVVCLAISKSGRYIASGQLTHMGYNADIIVWDYERLEQYAKFTLHKVKVQALAFSPNEVYLASLGGQDDGSVVIWSLAKREAICGSPAQHQSAGITECLAYSNTNDNIFITAGDNTMRVWELDLENRKIRPNECNLGSIKRTIKCLAVTDDDSLFYCGTSSGDILGITLNTHLLTCLGPEKDRLSQGITCIVPLLTGDLLVGSGAGQVLRMRVLEKKEKHRSTLRLVRSENCEQLMGGVTSISLRGQGHQFFVGTDMCNVYKFSLPDFRPELLDTSHYSAINDVVFPNNSSELIVTCSYQDIRAYHVRSQKELLRINLANKTCNCVCVLDDGSAILSGWNDGKIRAFYPESGKLMYCVENAHNKGVTAIAATSSCRKLLSGGGEGQVRVWCVNESVSRPAAYQPFAHRSKQASNQPVVTYDVRLELAMNEHKNCVTFIKMSKNDARCVSASADGTCIIWDLKNGSREQVIFASTLFRAVCWGPKECQIIASGTDRKIGYWEAADANLIRELEASRSGSINALDASPDEQYFVSGGDDKMLKLWHYNLGTVQHVGIGHSTPITSVKISPDSKYIVSVSEDGAIYFWDYPRMLDSNNDC